jgi:tetratricopeptide (TPR) repeat protein
MVDPTLLKGYNALKVKDLKKAHELFQSFYKRATSNEDRYNSLIGLALTYRELGETSRSIELLKKATGMVSNPKIALYNLANIYEEIGEHALAIQNYDLVISMDPTMYEAHVNRGVSWYNLEKFNEGMNDFNNSNKIGKERSISLSNMGIILLQQKKFESSIDQFDRSLELDPENIHALCGKGLALYNMDRYDESMICFDAATSINPDFYIAHYFKGHIMRGLDLMNEAEESIREAIKIRDNYPLAWFELGEIEKARMNHENALKAYDKASRTHQGTYEEALFQKAKIYMSMNNPSSAVKELKRICKANPNVGKVWLEMARALLKMKDKQDAATKALNNAYLLIPSDSDVVNLLSKQLIREKNLKKAKSILLKGMEKDPHPENGLLLATLQKESGEFSDAIITSEEVLSMDPRILDAWLIMGRAYGEMGKMEEYKQCLRKYLHKNPDNDRVKEEMDSIST